MNEQLITSENVSIELLRTIFEDAYFETSLESDGSLKIQGRYGYYAFVSQTKRFIRFVVWLKPNDKAERAARIEFANRINREAVLVRAFDCDNSIGFDHHVWIQGGVTPKNVVMAFRSLGDLVQEALTRDKEGVFTAT